MAQLSASDLDLIDRLKQDDESAMAVIYKAYWEPLYRSAYNVFKNREICEDIVQELFIRLWKNRHAVEISISLKAYLHASIRYEVFRQIRAGRANEHIYDDLLERLHAPAVHTSIEYEELVTQISSIVEQLPEKCREVYKLSRQENLSHKQIAERLNISTKTVENHLTKALRLLRTSLGAELTLLLVQHYLRK